jgi:hypothetical protein|uniref:Trimeric autotransporter adhesin YadA-like head domain-containing protein n=1 Tax=viral metagenome TaxID=1070528 RepID=A0A6C0IX10_9ZZZZ
MKILIFVNIKNMAFVLPQSTTAKNVEANTVSARVMKADTVIVGEGGLVGVATGASTLSEVLTEGNDANSQNIEQVYALTFHQNALENWATEVCNNVIISTPEHTPWPYGGYTIQDNGNGGAYNNVAIGGAITSNAYGNVVIGFSAGRNSTQATLANMNTIIGYYSLDNSTVNGRNNTAVGAFAGKNATIGGIYNTMLGSTSGFNATMDAGNICVGYNSGYNATMTSRNICVGYRSCYNATLSNENICIGSFSGAFQTMVDNNICLGRQSNVATGASNAVAIGKQAVAPNGGLAINTSGTATSSFQTTWQKLTAVPPSAGTLAIPNAAAFLRITLGSTSYDIPLCNADAT